MADLDNVLNKIRDATDPKKVADGLAANQKIIPLDPHDIQATDTSSPVPLIDNETILDEEWAKRAFLIPDEEFDYEYDVVNRYWSSAENKFTDSSLGGNIGINAKPQFTRYSDIRVKGRLHDRSDVSLGNTSGGYGMGNYYSKAIDDPSESIYLRFGVPTFNSIANFLKTTIDPKTAYLVKTGRIRSGAFDAGKYVGAIALFIHFPAAAVAIHSAKAIANFLIKPTSKWYRLKPTMHDYWRTVDFLVNTLAVNMKIYPKIFNPNKTNQFQEIGSIFELDSDHQEKLKELLPGVFGENNNYDILSIANRAQRYANRLFKEELNKSVKDFTGYVKKLEDTSHPTLYKNREGVLSIGSRIRELITIGEAVTSTNIDDKKKRFTELKDYSEESISDRLISENNKARVTSNESDPLVKTNDNDEGEQEEYANEFIEALQSDFTDGSAYVILKVDHSGSNSESFSNTSSQSELSNTLNSAVSSANAARFNTAGLKLTDLPKLMSSVLEIAGDAVTGVLSGATFGLSDFVITGSNVDIPEYWSGSSTNLHHPSYTIKLISPYNNPISRMQNIGIPLCMILAGFLPRSTGGQSYGSPYICSVFNTGRTQKQLCIIDSLSITRGTSNLPYDKEGNTLAIDVSFSIKDLANTMHVPTVSGADGEPLMDEDNILVDYLAVLAGQDLYSQRYAIPKEKLNFAKKLMTKSHIVSPAYWASLGHDALTSGHLRYLTLGAGKIYEGVNAASTLVPRN